MKKKRIISVALATLLTTIGLLGVPVSVKAETTASNDATIEFKNGEGHQGVVDPEHPDVIVNPGVSPATEGRLRIDYVPQLHFGKQSLKNKKRQFPANAQLFHDGTSPRGEFVQISDYRGASLGWTLQIRQETQFQNVAAKNPQIKGAVISFDQSWTNSTKDQAEAPEVSKEVISLSNVGETYNLATAKPGKGSGTWSIAFGSSGDNPLKLPNTLTPDVDEAGNAIVDSEFENQQVYENSAIKLSIPETTKIDPVPYHTVITWILAELP